MIIYNVTINIENLFAKEWMEWMMKVHIPEVMQTGCFTNYHILRVLADEDSGGKTFSVQYYCNAMNDYDNYIRDFAPVLRQRAFDKFGDKFVAFRTLLEVIK